MFKMLAEETVGRPKLGNFEFGLDCHHADLDYMPCSGSETSGALHRVLMSGGSPLGKVIPI